MHIAVKKVNVPCAMCNPSVTYDLTGNSMLEVEPTGERMALWPPEVAVTALTLKNLRRQYLHNHGYY